MGGTRERLEHRSSNQSEDVLPPLPHAGEGWGEGHTTRVSGILGAVLDGLPGRELLVTVRQKSFRVSGGMVAVA